MEKWAKNFVIFLGSLSLIWLTQIKTPATLPERFPAPQIHSLPATLAMWQDPSNSGDYFDQVKGAEFGYLIWSQFPVKVFVEWPGNTHRPQDWVDAVWNGVAEWGKYLPLERVNTAEFADIILVRKSPGWRQGERARSAEARYQLYHKHQQNQTILAHRFTIFLSPTQAGHYISAAARHEFGHALGIWGHSLSDSDVMYFAQVRNPPPISARDVNTLKRIYEQPTRLGGVMQ